MEVDYDIVVVGAGMIGSAAAKYITTENKGLRVALIGPSEPQRRVDASIHAAHYDEGRICRTVGGNVIWNTAAKRSLDRFRDIEKKSGFEIYKEVGYMLVTPIGSKRGIDFINNIKFTGQDSHPVFIENPQALHKDFPYMDFGEDVHGIYLTKKSGHINPRNLVKAQKYLAKEAGCVYIDDVVDLLRCDDSGVYRMTLAKGQEVTSRKVLLATGSFTDCRDLLPGGIQPDMSYQPNTVILVEMNETDRRSLASMPCIGYTGGKWDAPHLNFVAYIMPPIQYPDGKYYLKVGHGNQPRPLRSVEEATNWYQRGTDPNMNQYLTDLTRCLFPHISMDRYKFDHCVTTSTPKGYPYIDLVSPGLGVAIGGCGQGAKGSDELGRVAARMIVKGKWDHDFPEGAFKFKEVWRKKTTEFTSKL